MLLLSVRPFLSCALAALMAAPPVSAVIELKPETLRAFERYVSLREPQIEAELKNEKAILWVDRLPEKERLKAFAELKRGEVFIERLQTRGPDGQEVKVPDGLVHHWLGTVFIPRANLQQAMALVQDYDGHATNYAPDVVVSRTLNKKGDCFRVNMRFLKKKLGFGAVIDTDQEVCYEPLGPHRVHSTAYTRRVQQVQNAGESTQTLLPAGKDDGYLWHLYTYWIFEERSGGVYVQCEAISLSRDIPWYAQLFRKFITSIPRESLMFSLGTTRTLLLKKNGGHPVNSAP